MRPRNRADCSKTPRGASSAGMFDGRTAAGDQIAIAIAALPSVIVSEAHAAACWGLMNEAIELDGGD